MFQQVGKKGGVPGKDVAFTASWFRAHALESGRLDKIPGPSLIMRGNQAMLLLEVSVFASVTWR